MRLFAIAIGTIGVLMISASAQDVAPGRFAIESSVDGFVRLDTETGAVSHCRRRDEVWRCEVLAEDQSAIAAIADDVRAIRERLDALSARIEGLEARTQVVAPPGPQEIQPEPGFAEVLIQRLFDLVRDIKREQQANS